VACKKQARKRERKLNNERYEKTYFLCLDLATHILGEESNTNDRHNLAMSILGYIESDTWREDLEIE
jgi:hypothetical protein